MPDTTYQPSVYRKQGGDELVVASGGQITIEDGGILKMGTSGPTMVAGTDKPIIYRSGAMAAVDTAGGIFAAANPEGAAIILVGLWLDVTTNPTTCTVDAGIAVDGTTLNDTMIDGANIGATGVFNHIKHAGTNGVGAKRWESSEFLTVSTASGASTNLVGTVTYAYYIA